MDDNQEKNEIKENDINEINHEYFQQNNKEIEEKKEISKEDIIVERIFKTKGDVEIFRYFKNRILGCGSFGKVYEVTCEWSSKKYACKVIPLKHKNKNSKFNVDKIFNEINIHKLLNHPHVLKFIHHFADANNIYILTELCKYQTLSSLLKKRGGPLTELEIQYYSIQIISAMKYLNDNYILHRDLKLSNIFISDNMKIKIGDFGLSTNMYDPYGGFSRLYGTKYYIAPEMLDSYTYKLKSDIWSFGVVLYVLATDDFPFKCGNMKKFKRAVFRKYYRKPYKYRKISPEFCDLINKIFFYDPYNRLTWNGILNHDFFKIGKSIPRSLYISNLEFPPSLELIKKYIPNFDEIASIKARNRFKYKDKENNNNPNNNKKKKNNEQSEAEKIVEEINHKTYIKKINILDKDYEFYAINHILNQKFINSVDENKGAKPPEIYVKKYLNEKKDFGIVYLLSNGNYGIYFNDKSQIIADLNFKNYYFLENEAGKIKFFHYKINDKLEKCFEEKLNLLEIYKNYFDKITNKKIPPLEGLYADEVDEKENKILNDQEKEVPIHIKYSVQTNNAISFGFTNCSFQTIFEDKTEIILSFEEKTVTYIDKERNYWTFHHQNAFNNRNKEMKEKLTYVKYLIRLLRENLDDNFEK